MASHIGRRKFLATLGGAAAWPLATRAQQAERVRRIGVLSGLAENGPKGRARIAAFRDGLQRLGWNAVAVTRANSAGIVGDGGAW
jgi:putative ABC transport system substrate-binding protein